MDFEKFLIPERDKNDFAFVDLGFLRGYSLAVAELIRMYGISTECRELWRSGGYKIDEIKKHIAPEDYEVLILHKSELEKSTNHNQEGGSHD